MLPAQPQMPDIQKLNALQGQPGVTFPTGSMLEDGLGDYLAPAVFSPAAARPGARPAVRLHDSMRGHPAAYQAVAPMPDHALFVAHIMNELIEGEPEMLSVRSEEEGLAGPAARSEELAGAQVVGSSRAAAAGRGVVPSQAGRWGGAGSSGAGPAPFPGRTPLAGVSGSGLSGGGRSKGLRSVSASAEQVLSFSCSPHR